MKHCCLGIVASLLLTVSAWADLTIHLQSPFRDNATSSGYIPHIVGGVTDYNPGFGATSRTMMKSEGDSWYSYTWEGKTVADFQDWQDFEFKACPNTDDYNFNNNNCVSWTEGGKTRITAFFGTETEIWLYTDTKDKSYRKSFMAPGSKIVWFKSPWGNKVLPQMIFGTDSVLMRFNEGDKEKCGWFYGALTPAMIEANPLLMGYFVRYKAPWYTVPASRDSFVDFAGLLQVQDTLYVDGTVPNPVVSAEIGTAGECFDPTRRLHIYHPWRTNTTFRDSTFYIKIDNNILNAPTGLSSEGEYKYWRHIDFADSLVGSAQWNSQMSTVQILRGSNDWPQHPYFQDSQRPHASDFFPTGIYETWFYTSTSLETFELAFYPPEPKVIRLKSPWENQSPSMVIESTGDIIKMGPLTDTCGWYTGTVYKHATDWRVYFKQTFGMERYGGKGVVAELDNLDSLISLDSLMALHDTVWVYPNPKQRYEPSDTTRYPGILGICPSLKISALVVDWAGESHDDGIDVDFGGIYQGNAYTTIMGLDQNGDLAELKTCSGHVPGMVQDTLVNGAPARVDSLVYPWAQCSAAREIEKWFIPQVVAKDAAGNEYKNGVCRDISLTLDEEGFWQADFTNEEGDCNDTINPGFYPIDDLQYLDSAKTVLNPKFDWDIQGCKHNYSFAMKVSAQFRYVKGQYFEFRGDDDVWVFINNRLVVDIGGCHSPVEGGVNLDTIGQNDPSLKLVEGREYPFHIFFSERNATGSNFKMRTSINLQTQKTYYPVEEKTTDGTIKYTILQLLMDESISCDVSSTSKIDTMPAQSSFVLFGDDDRIPSTGMELLPGSVAGINIDENMAGFVIDTVEIVRKRSLAPGSYMLQFFLASDMTQSSEVFFTVPAYPLPDIAFIDVFSGVDSVRIFDPTGISLRGLPFDGSANDTLLTHVAYPDTVPLQVGVFYIANLCKDCFAVLDLTTSFPISFLDEKKQRVNKLITDSTGVAKFYVVGDSSVTNASFEISGGAVANVISWGSIHFKEPPVPFANSGEAFDRNGDGVLDSISIVFNKAFDETIPDTIAWTFGSDDWHTVASAQSVALLMQDEKSLAIHADSLQNKVFTGGAKELYQGSFRYHYTYMDKETGQMTQLSLDGLAIEDRMGAILVDKPIVKPVSGNLNKLTVYISEAARMDLVNGIQFLEFKDKTGELVNPSLLSVMSVIPAMTSNYFDVLYQKKDDTILPEVGFMVRLVPGVLPDLNGNVPHVDNPWLRIEGEQRVGVESPGVVGIDPANWNPGTWPYQNDVAPVRVDVAKNIDDVIAETGLPGELIKFDLSEVAKTLLLNSSESRDVVLSKVKIKWEVEYFSTLGQFVNSQKGEVACNDKDVFGSDCVENPGNVFLMWDARSNKGRFVGTGVYIAKLKFKIFQGDKVAGKSEETFTLGIRRHGNK
ncbi:conserved domain protein [Fibrobacter succinogenes subsp. succinogenes S85]|uniref:Conserved domain protein n=1 Tax=Fibrobacter succinogenes (strain ATCC 19169 / S85) TaxID=59374 RepID=C9RR86_FIBSS|nr:fibro-slime domain-containing protein [Fibrobacter succinogenes]ACX75072.1 fibro-slime family protein [Fibrobacter succinogenes subsp. succinogenes S85]ADL26651.1 conserved domain protein [Fibrobacter succinogenes subsp. succinogenes S85]